MYMWVCVYMCGSQKTTLVSILPCILFAAVYTILVLKLLGILLSLLLIFFTEVLRLQGCVTVPSSYMVLGI